MQDRRRFMLDLFLSVFRQGKDVCVEAIDRNRERQSNLSYEEQRGRWGWGGGGGGKGRGAERRDMGIFETDLQLALNISCSRLS